MRKLPGNEPGNDSENESVNEPEELLDLVWDNAGLSEDEITSLNFYIFRMDKDTKTYKYCTRFGSDFEIDHLCQKCGGGKYKINRRVGSRFIDSKVIEIDEITNPTIKTSLNLPIPVVATPASDNTEKIMAMFLAVLTPVLNKLADTSKVPSVTKKDIMEEMQFYKSMFSNPSADPMALMNHVLNFVKTGMDVGKDIVADQAQDTSLLGTVRQFLPQVLDTVKTLAPGKAASDAPVPGGVAPVQAAPKFSNPLIQKYSTNQPVGNFLRELYTGILYDADPLNFYYKIISDAALAELKADVLQTENLKLIEALGTIPEYNQLLTNADNLEWVNEFFDYVKGARKPEDDSEGGDENLNGGKKKAKVAKGA